MTTGTTSYDWRSDVQSPIFGDSATHFIGRLGRKTWSGANSITASTPRATYRTRPIGPLQYRRAAKKGKANWLLRMNLPPNAYHMERSETENAIHRIIGPSSSSAKSQGCLNMPSFDFYDDPAFRYKVFDKLNDTLYGSGFAPLVFLAEGQQALDMISSTATRIRLGIRALVRGNPRGVINALGIAAPSKKWCKQVGGLKKARRARLVNGVPEEATPQTCDIVRRQGTIFSAMSALWLEVQYGWLPLLSDAEAAAKWLAYAVNGINLPRRFCVSGKMQNQLKPVSWSVYSPASWSGCREIRRMKVTVLGGVASSPYLPNLASLAEVAWEKMPWSFAIDWYVPIGSYLSALSMQRRLTGTVVTTYSIEREYCDPVSYNPKYTYGGCVLGTERAHTFELTRSVDTTLPVPHPFTDFLSKSQGYKSWRHAANAVALLIQPLHKHGFVN